MLRHAPPDFQKSFWTEEILDVGMMVTRANWLGVILGVVHLIAAVQGEGLFLTF